MYEWYTCRNLLGYEWSSVDCPALGPWKTFLLDYSLYLQLKIHQEKLQFLVEVFQLPTSSCESHASSRKQRCLYAFFCSLLKNTEMCLLDIKLLSISQTFRLSKGSIYFFSFSLSSLYKDKLSVTRTN